MTNAVVGMETLAAIDGYLMETAEYQLSPPIPSPNRKEAAPSPTNTSDSEYEPTPSITPDEASPRLGPESSGSVPELLSRIEHLEMSGEDQAAILRAIGREKVRTGDVEVKMGLTTVEVTWLAQGSLGLDLKEELVGKEWFMPETGYAKVDQILHPDLQWCTSFLKGLRVMAVDDVCAPGTLKGVIAQLRTTSRPLTIRFADPKPQERLTDKIERLASTTKQQADRTIEASGKLRDNQKVASGLREKRSRGEALNLSEERHLAQLGEDYQRLAPVLFIGAMPVIGDILLPLYVTGDGALPSTFTRTEELQEQLLLKQEAHLEVSSAVQAKVLEQWSMMDKFDTVKDVYVSAMAGTPVGTGDLLRLSEWYLEEGYKRDSIPLPLLRDMAKVSGTPLTGGEDSRWVRRELTKRLKEVMAEDKRISSEGVECLWDEDLMQLAANRGILFGHLVERADSSTMMLQAQMKTWLELAVDKAVPVFLLFLFPKLCDAHNFAESAGVFAGACVEEVADGETSLL